MGFGGDFLLRWFGSSFSPAFPNFKLTLGHFVYAVKGNLLQGLLPPRLPRRRMRPMWAMTTDKYTFTKVRWPRHILTGKEVAVKVINKSQQNSSGLQRRSHKVKINEGLGSPQHDEIIWSDGDGGNTLFCRGVCWRRWDVPLPGGSWQHERERGSKHILAKNVHGTVLQPENPPWVLTWTSRLQTLASATNSPLAVSGIPCVPAPHPLVPSRPEVRWPHSGCGEPESSYKYTGHWSLPFDGQSLKEQEEQVLSGIHHTSFYLSTECENLLKKFLTLNSSKGGTF